MQAVINTLGLKNCEPCTWEAGIPRAYKYPDGEVFVTPPVKGFVLCASFTLPEFPTGSRPDDLTPLLERLASTFDEVQYFFTYRVADGHGWAIYRGGAKVRSFGFFDGEATWEFGAPTDVEMDRDLEFPDEDDVMAIAASWSVDPSELESMNLETTQGIIGRL
jgi:hypothetical protein